MEHWWEGVIARPANLFEVGSRRMMRSSHHSWLKSKTAGGTAEADRPNGHQSSAGKEIMTKMIMPSTRHNLQEVMGDLKEVLHDMEGMLKGIPNDLSGEMQGLRSRLNSTVKSARKRCHHLERRAAAGVEHADAWVRDRPYLVAGSVLAIGCLVGLLCASRR
jgi:ElaB/YqjD/DUF883 family membrane-anchored ribosome-binding protein